MWECSVSFHQYFKQTRTLDIEIWTPAGETIHPQCGGKINREEFGDRVRWHCTLCGSSGEFQRGVRYQTKDELAEQLASNGGYM
jgi:hypothetical protein